MRRMAALNQDRDPDPSEGNEHSESDNSQRSRPCPPPNRRTPQIPRPPRAEPSDNPDTSERACLGCECGRSDRHDFVTVPPAARSPCSRVSRNPETHTDKNSSVAFPPKSAVASMAGIDDASLGESNLPPTNHGDVVDGRKVSRVSEAAAHPMHGFESGSRRGARAAAPARPRATRRGRASALASLARAKGSATPAASGMRVLARAAAEQKLGLLRLRCSPSRLH